MSKFSFTHLRWVRTAEIPFRVNASFVGSDPQPIFLQIFRLSCIVFRIYFTHWCTGVLRYCCCLLLSWCLGLFMLLFGWCLRLCGLIFAGLWIITNCLGDILRVLLLWITVLILLWCLHFTWMLLWFYPPGRGNTLLVVAGITVVFAGFDYRSRLLCVRALLRLCALLVLDTLFRRIRCISRILVRCLIVEIRWLRHYDDLWSISRWIRGFNFSFLPFGSCLHLFFTVFTMFLRKFLQMFFFTFRYLFRLLDCIFVLCMQRTIRLRSSINYIGALTSLILHIQICLQIDDFMLQNGLLKHLWADYLLLLWVYAMDFILQRLWILLLLLNLFCTSDNGLFNLWDLQV